MGLADEISENARISFDANVLIYYVEENPEFLHVVEPAFELIIAGRLTAEVSLIVLLEVLVRPIREGLESVANKYRAILEGTMGITAHILDQPLAELAAQIRARHGLRTPDAIVAATAIGHNCSHILTNGPVFRRLDNMKVLVIGDYV